MVLAAGLGTRLKPFTDRIPKPLIPLHGVPCIEFAFRSMKAAGVRDALVNVHAHPDQMRTYLQGDPLPGLRVMESDESQKLLGSAGGLRQAVSFFQDQSFFSMNADVFHVAPLAQLAERHAELRKKQGVLFTLVLANGAALENQEGEYREIQVDEGTGLITGFGEKKAQVPFFTGTAIFEPEAFAGIQHGVPAEFVPEVLEPAIRAGKAGFLYSDALWLDIGSPRLWFQAEHQIRKRLAEGRIPEPFLTRLNTADLTLGGRFELGKNSIRLEDILYEIESLRGF